MRIKQGENAHHLGCFDYHGKVAWDRCGSCAYPILAVGDDMPDNELWLSFDCSVEH